MSGFIFEYLIHFIKQKKARNFSLTPQNTLFEDMLVVDIYFYIDTYFVELYTLYTNTKASCKNVFLSGQLRSQKKPQ